jgi:3-methyladenine DNA glycosylase AlkC
MTDKELEQYYFELQKMFRTKGWKSFIEDMKDNAQVVDSVEYTRDDKDLYYRKGQLAVIANILNLEDSILSAQEEHEVVH